ncbi:unnamed protein product, partial [Clonostachys byssicola]
MPWHADYNHSPGFEALTESVDDDYNIKAIVNWQLARFVPAEEAFGPSLFTANIGQLYGGTPGLGSDDHMFASEVQQTGNQELIKFASSDDLARRFQLGLADHFGIARWRTLIGLCGSLFEQEYNDHTSTLPTLSTRTGWTSGCWVVSYSNKNITKTTRSFGLKEIGSCKLEV